MKKSIKLSLYSSMMAIVLTGQVNAIESPTASMTTTVSASVPVTFSSNVAFVLYDGLGQNPQKNAASFSLTLGANASISIVNDTVAGSNMKGVYTGIKKPLTNADAVSIDHFDTEALRWLAVYEEQSAKNISQLNVKFTGLDASKQIVGEKTLEADVLYPFEGSVVTIEDKAAVTLGIDDVPATAINAAKQADAWNPASQSSTMTISSPIASDKVAYIPLAFVVGSEDVSTEIEYMNAFGDASAYSFSGINIQIQATFS